MYVRNPIDVWNVGTLDTELQSTLAKNAELIQSYMRADHEIESEYQASDHVHMRRNNDFASGFLALQQSLIALLNERSIRAWHYTRLTASEVVTIQRDGLELSTLESLRRRLDALIMVGSLDPSQADAIYDHSPFNGRQHNARAQKFWMTSHPLPIDYSGVVPLMASWGGESAYFWQRDETLLEILMKLGEPRIIEVAVPLNLTSHAYSASTSIVSNFSRTLGCNPEKQAFDL